MPDATSSTEPAGSNGSSTSAEQTWQAYPSSGPPAGPYAPPPINPYAAPYVDPGFDPQPTPPYVPYGGTRPYDLVPPTGYGTNPYEVNPYQPAYGGYGSYGVVPIQHPRAVPAMVLGIIGIVLAGSCGIGGLLGIGGIVLGRKARNEIDAEPGRYAGRSQATAGHRHRHHRHGTGDSDHDLDRRRVRRRRRPGGVLSTRRTPDREECCA